MLFNVIIMYHKNPIKNLNRGVTTVPKALHKFINLFRKRNWDMFIMNYYVKNILMFQKMPQKYLFSMKIPVENVKFFPKMSCGTARHGTLSKFSLTGTARHGTLSIFFLTGTARHGTLLNFLLTGTALLPCRAVPCRSCRAVPVISNPAIGGCYLVETP